MTFRQANNINSVTLRSICRTLGACKVEEAMQHTPMTRIGVRNFRMTRQYFWQSARRRRARPAPRKGHA
jgi:hypothetical protein